MSEETENEQVAENRAAYSIALPEQKAFFKIPARFGHACLPKPLRRRVPACPAVVPKRRRMAEEPLGYDHERRFEQHYPRIELPFQLVDTVETGIKRRYEKEELFQNGLNRLFFGDCLRVMRTCPAIVSERRRMLPTCLPRRARTRRRQGECIDLIYIDPPFFSGRNYNIIFGDLSARQAGKNEVRPFTDIWEGGIRGYLIWLNARLYEMKRLLKPTGSIYVHLDSGDPGRHILRSDDNKGFSEKDDDSREPNRRGGEQWLRFK